MSISKKTSGSSDNYYHEGGSVGFLLIHGLGGSPLTLRLLGQGLARQGYTVSCPFVPGLAGGSDLDGLSSWKDWYATVEKAFLELKETCDRVIVGGLSTGAVLSLRLAQEYGDDIEALTLYAPTLSPNGHAVPKTFKLTWLIHQKWFANLFLFSKGLPYGIKDARMRNFWLDMMSSQGVSMIDAIGVRGGKLLELRWLCREIRKNWGGIKNRALVIHSREDDMSDVSNSFEVVRSMRGQAELFVLNDSYHMVTIDRQREQVVNRTIEFVDQVLSASDKKQRPAPASRPSILRSSSGAAE